MLCQPLSIRAICALGANVPGKGARANFVIYDDPMSTTLYETLDTSISVTRVAARCEHCYQLPKESRLQRTTIHRPARLHHSVRILFC